MRQGNTQNRQRTRGRGNNSRVNNNRSNPNRSMESNGPEVRIRGTAAHIADKYMQLARDAQSAGDAIAAENYLQHAEHYNRVIAQHQLNQSYQKNNNVKSGAEGTEGSAENVSAQNGAESTTEANGASEPDRRPRKRTSRKTNDENNETGEVEKTELPTFISGGAGDTNANE